MKEQLKQKAELVEAFLQTELAHCSVNDNLTQIMNYAVSNGGKRLRPIFLLGVYELFCEDITPAVPYGAALEMIHSYSLVHDDLPAMDNDDMRRGKPTCHKQFSEFGAILAGDALLNFSFETMLKYANRFPLERSLEAISYIAAASGAKGMCGGQMTDMEQSVTDFESLCRMYQGKTGALLKASVVAGGMLGGASEEIISILEHFAEKIGLIFQIKDDVLDVTSDVKTLGKPVFSDEKNQKITFVSQYGIKQCNQLMADYESEALNDLERIETILQKPNGADFLKQLTCYLTARNY